MTFNLICFWNNKLFTFYRMSDLDIEIFLINSECNKLDTIELKSIVLSLFHLRMCVENNQRVNVTRTNTYRKLYQV